MAANILGAGHAQLMILTLVTQSKMQMHLETNSDSSKMICRGVVIELISLVAMNCGWIESSKNCIPLS